MYFIQQVFIFHWKSKIVLSIIVHKKIKNCDFKVYYWIARWIIIKQIPKNENLTVVTKCVIIKHFVFKQSVT